jgi:hypothetical protein
MYVTLDIVSATYSRLDLTYCIRRKLYCLVVQCLAREKARHIVYALSEEGATCVRPPWEVRRSYVSPGVGTGDQSAPLMSIDAFSHFIFPNRHILLMRVLGLRPLHTIRYKPHRASQ